MFSHSLYKTREYVGFVLFIFSFWLLSTIASAQQISEIHFDPDGSDTDREWIEVYNDTNNTIDLTEIKFFEANINHGIDIFNQANSTEKNISASEYVVIVQDINKFKADFPNYTGKIFKSSFSLSNTGETLALKDKEGNILFTVNYTSADKQAVPSPGQVNSGSLPANNSTTTNQTSSTTNTTSTSTNTTNQNTNTGNETINYFYRSYWPETEKIYVKAGENKAVMQGQVIVFDPKVLDGNKKEVKTGLMYKWNFGDGYTSEKREGLHAYKFVGEFVVYLQVNHNGYIDENKMYVKVVEPKLDIKIVEKEIDNQKIDVIEIVNKNNFELNIGNLELKNENNKTYLLPDKLFVLGNKSIFLAPELTGFGSSTEKVILSLLSGKVLSSSTFPLAPFQKGELVPQVQSISTSSTSTSVLLNNKLISSPSRKIVVKKINPAPVAKPEVKEEIKKEIIPEPVQNSNRIEFKNEPTFSFFDQLKKIWGM